MLKMLLGQIDFLDSAIGKVSARIEEVSDPLFREAESGRGLHARDNACQMPERKLV
jgi:hypothetical protein